MTKKAPQISDALFPVGVESVFMEKQSARQLNLFGNEVLDPKNTHREYLKIPKFRAIIAKDNNQVFAVVTGNYHLVSNAEALKMGEECFRQVLTLTKTEDMEFHNLIMPATRSFCHIDFIHKGKKHDLFSKDDSWYPFLRISNSYNRTLALNFKVGYCRWICRNGMIFGGQSIDFKYHHGRQIEKAETHFRLRSGAFVDLEKAFFESLHNLKRYHVPPQLIWPLTCKVFGITKPDLENRQQANMYAMRKRRVEELATKYFAEMGQNGYAALNILTDFATRPVGYISVSQTIDALQHKAGEWVDEFVAAIADTSFTYDAYLADYLEHAA